MYLLLGPLSFTRMVLLALAERFTVTVTLFAQWVGAHRYLVFASPELYPPTDERRYGNSGNASPLCGKQVHITNTANGKSVTVTVADDCPTCKNSNSIDLSVAAFKVLAPLNDGVADIKWSFV